jgi:hypothetical protein
MLQQGKSIPTEGAIPSWVPDTRVMLPHQPYSPSMARVAQPSVLWLKSCRHSANSMVSRSAGAQEIKNRGKAIKNKTLKFIIISPF